MTDRDWKKELETVGGAVGKSYKTRSGEKRICVADYRLGEFKVDFPLLMVDSQKCSTVLPAGTVYKASGSENDIVDAWIDEPVKVKVKRVKLFITYPKIDYIFESNWFKNEEDFTKDLNSDYVIISREYKEFDENRR